MNRKFIDKEDEWHCLFLTYDSIRGKESWNGGQPHYHYISDKFGIPRAEWLRGQLNGHLNSTLSKSNANLSNILDMDIVRQRLNSFNAGEKS